MCQDIIIIIVFNDRVVMVVIPVRWGRG